MGKEETEQQPESVMEYLLKYGWAILVILVILALLLYLGAIRPQGQPPTNNITNIILPKISPVAAALYNISSQVKNCEVVETSNIAFCTYELSPSERAQTNNTINSTYVAFIYYHVNGSYWFSPVWFSMRANETIS